MYKGSNSLSKYVYKGSNALSKKVYKGNNAPSKYKYKGSNALSKYMHKGSNALSKYMYKGSNAPMLPVDTELDRSGHNTTQCKSFHTTENIDLDPEMLASNSAQ